MRKDTRPDWNAIRADYIAGGISQRKLAKKYGVSENTLIRRANVEKWAEQRGGVYNVVTAEIQQKTAEAAADNAVIAREIQRDLLERLKRISMKYPQDATEVRQQKDGKTMVYKFTDLTRAYHDLMDNTDVNVNVNLQRFDALDEAFEALKDEAQ